MSDKNTELLSAQAALRRSCVGVNASSEPLQPLCREYRGVSPQRHSRWPRLGAGALGGAKLLPALFVIGSLKTGTTSLWAQLVDNTDGHVISGSLTEKGDVSRKEKDFFGDPSMWRRGSAWYERIWPSCPAGSDAAAAGSLVAIDATPAYHVWHDAPQNMATFFGAALLPRLRLVWMLRDPIAKFWSYFWEIKAYGGEWDRVSFPQFAEPKLARTRECLKLDPASPLWPPSLPPPYQNCAPHLDHGLYEPQMRRWLKFFKPEQFLLISFAGYIRRPAAVVRDVLLHAQLPTTVAYHAASRARATSSKLRNSRARGRIGPPPRLFEQLYALYQPFIERLYGIIQQHEMAVSPCEHRGTRFLDSPNASTYAALRRRGGGGKSTGRHGRKS